MNDSAHIESSREKQSAALSRMAALNVSQLILLQSLGNYARLCITGTCHALSKPNAFSARSAIKLDTFVKKLSRNRDKLVRELERELMLWFVGKRPHPLKMEGPGSLSIMDSENSDMEVLKARMENQLNDYLHLEISDFQKRWKKVQAEKFDPNSSIISPVLQGLFIVEFFRSKKFPKEINDKLISNFANGFPAECKKIHGELNDAFQAMGLKSGGWEIYNGTQRMMPTQQI